MAIEGSILPYSFIEDEEERNKLLELNRRFPPSMWFQGGDTAARTITPADASTVGNRITADQLMNMSSSGAAYRQAAEGRVNALRRLVGMSDVSLPASTLGTSLRSYTTGTDDEILQKIINLQSQAGLRSLDEHRTWYTNSGFDPHFFDKSRDAFRDYLTARQGEITHEISIGKEGERRVYEGNKKGRDEAFIEATSKIRRRTPGPVTQADIGETLNQMYSRLAVLGTKSGEVSSYGAAFEKIKVIEEKRRKGEIDDAVAEIASDIMEKVAKGEIKGAQALSQYDLRTRGYPSAERKAAREPLDSLIEQTEAELKEVDIGAKRKLELAKLREDERLAGLEEGKLTRAYDIAAEVVDKVREGKINWENANEIFKDRLRAVKGKDKRITDVQQINALSTYLTTQLEPLKPESIQASALSRRAAEWGELASKKDGVIIPANLAMLNFQVRSLTTSAFMEKFPEAGPITGASLGVLLGRQIENILYMIPEDDREDVWNYYSANLVNDDERVGFNKATPSFAAVVDLEKADSVAAALQELELDSKTIISIMRSLGFE